MKRELDKIKQLERSLQKQYRKEIWRPFIKAILEFNLVEPGDKIAVAISGGKDSLILAKLFQVLKQTNLFDFELEFISMDPGFSQENRQLLEDNFSILGIEAKIHDSEIFKVVDHISKEYPCYLCAKMRRGNLYAKAKELGCNKLALGHHIDDVVETVLLNIFYGGKYETMLPRLSSENFEDMELIRPLYYVEEKDIIRFMKNHSIEAMNCGCSVAAKKTSSKRREMKDLVAQLYLHHKDVKKSILSSTRNVNLSKILGYKEHM